MVINRNPRKAICFWRVLGERQEYLFPGFVLWQIWVTWDCLQLGLLRLICITFSCPFFVCLERSFPSTPHCWGFGCPTFIVSPSIFYTSRCVTGQGLSLGLGPAIGIRHEVEESPTHQHQLMQRLACHGRLPKGEGLSLLPSVKSVPCHPTLLCKTWLSRDRFGLSSLIQALPLDQ